MEKERLFCFDAALLLEHIFYGRVCMMIARTVGCFSTTGYCFDGAELKACKAALTGV